MPTPRRRLACLAALALPLLLPAASGWAVAEPAGTAPAAAPGRPQALAALQVPPPAPPLPRPGWGAAYAAASGTGGFGLAVSRADWAEAQQSAEARCRRRGGNSCRLVAEFTGRCGAVAQAVDRNVLVALRPLEPASILATTAASGETPEAAGQGALQACGQQGRGICVVVATSCAGR